jgi:hypothetical protein
MGLMGLMPNNMQEVNFTTGDLLQNEEIQFPQTDASPNEAIVPFRISDLRQREFIFAIGYVGQCGRGSRDVAGAQRCHSASDF